MSSSMRLITVIPARGGSKSIPFKNIQQLNGKPLLAYSIEYSKKSKFISHTIVSTDSEKIADIARQHGAEVPFIRPDEISGDDIQDFPVIEHALHQIERIYQTQIDAIVWLRPTSPLRPLGLIEKAVKILEDLPECTSIRCVVESKEHPYRQWYENDVYIRGVINEIDEPYNLPRQKLPKVYFQSGDIEVIRRETILNGSMSGEQVAPLVIEREDMLDIDHVDDLKSAEEKAGQALS